MKYSIADFRQLVTAWYNEFLPVECKDRFAFVKDAEILYLNSINLDLIRKKTMDFMKMKVKEIAGDGTTILVQEPKPVNNVRLKPTLKFLEGSDMIDDERRLKVMHMSNRRYVPTSTSILISQDKEIDGFLDGMFSELSSSKLRGRVKFLPLSSLPVQEAVDVARSFFPRKALSIIEVQEGEQILVKSSNDVLQPIHIQVNLLRPDDGNVDRFVERCRKSLLEEFEKLV